MIGQSSVCTKPMYPICSYVMSWGYLRCYACRTQIISKRFASHTEKGGRISWEKQIRKTSLSMQKKTMQQIILRIIIFLLYWRPCLPGSLTFRATWNIDFDAISKLFLHRNGQGVWIQAFWSYFALLLSHKFFIHFIGL